MTMADRSVREFLEVKGEYAIRNLTVFITIVVASLVVLYLAICVNSAGETRLPAEMFIAYLLAGGGVYQFGKWQDEKTQRFQIDSTPPPAPVTTVQNANVVNTNKDPSP